MNADAFRHLYAYHFSQNRSLWDLSRAALSWEQFSQPSAYSMGSARNQFVHLMSDDEMWFCGLRGAPIPDPLDPAQFTDWKVIRAYWDEVERQMQADLAALQDAMLFEKPFPDGVDKDLIRWQVLIHVVNHGTDHRAQLLRLLNDLGVDTSAQDYIFYAYDHP